MNEWSVWAEGGDLPVRALAVVGGFTVGAFLVGWLVQMLVRVLFRQTLPAWPRWIVRTLGGLLCGFLIYLWVFGGGGGGLGGLGGWIGGGKGGWPGEQGTTISRAKEPDKVSPPKPTKEPKEKPKEVPVSAETMRIEVLGDAPLEQIARAKTFDVRKRYRIQGEPGLHTLEDVQKRILQRRALAPPLGRLVIVVYQDSPALDRPQVSDLRNWAKDLEPALKVDYSEPDSNAPID